MAAQALIAALPCCAGGRPDGTARKDLETVVSFSGVPPAARRRSSVSRQRAGHHGIARANLCADHSIRRGRAFGAVWKKIESSGDTCFCPLPAERHPPVERHLPAERHPPVERHLPAERHPSVEGRPSRGVRPQSGIRLSNGVCPPGDVRPPSGIRPSNGIRPPADGRAWAHLIQNHPTCTIKQREPEPQSRSRAGRLPPAGSVFLHRRAGGPLEYKPP